MRSQENIQNDTTLIATQRAIIMGKAGWSQWKNLGSTARSMIKHLPGHTMFLQFGAHIAHVVGVIYVALR